MDDTDRAEAQKFARQQASLPTEPWRTQGWQLLALLRIGDALERIADPLGPRES